MTSSYLALVLLDVVLLGAGLAVLYGAGLVRSRGDALRHAGLAFMSGWASVGIVASTLLVVGVPVRRSVLVGFAVVLAVAAVVAARRVGAYRAPFVREPSWRSWPGAAAIVGATLVAIELASLLRRSLTDTAPLQWDAWAFWLPKARAIIDFGGLDTGMGGFTSFASPGYPPLVPVLDAMAFAFMGNTRAAPLALQSWIVAVAFFAALASLLSTRVRPALLWPCLALLVLLPTLTQLIGSSLGDEPLVESLGLAAACVALWTLEREPRLAVLAAIFLAAAALAKNEGMAIGLVLASTVLAISLVRTPRRLLVPVLLVLAPVVAAVPWRLWLRSHHVSAYPDYRLSDLFRPSVLGDKTDRLSYAAHHLPDYVLSPSRWLLAVPLLLVAAALSARRRPELSILAVVAVVFVPLSMLVVYWISAPDIVYYVTTSAERGAASAAVLACVYLPLLLAEAAREGGP
jgi:hypothetical protein